MNLLKITWANIVHKPLNTLLILLLLSFGVGLISLMIVLNVSLQKQFERNVKDIDLVLGAKGSSLQLLLSAVYHVDAPTGNISVKDFEAFKRDRKTRIFIKNAIPMSYGDSYEKFRIVGTTHAYAAHYGAEPAIGELWKVPVLDSLDRVVTENFSHNEHGMRVDTIEATIGHKVALQTGMGVGDTFFSFHGLDNANEAHYNVVFKVSGVFGETRTVVDQLILSSLESIWAIHPPKEGAGPKDREITAALIQVTNSIGVLSLNGSEQIKKGNMILAAPAIEINRLTQQFGIGMSVMSAIGILIAIISFISVFISLFNSLKDRKYELALIRTMGGGRAKVFMLILQEGLILSALGFGLGLILSRIGLLAMSSALADEFHYTLSDLGLVNSEYLMFAITIFVGCLASLLPAFKAVRIDISKTLADG